MLLRRSTGVFRVQSLLSIVLDRVATATRKPAHDGPESVGIGRIVSSIKICKYVEHVEIAHQESGIGLERPHRLAISAVVINNPYPSEYTDDLITIANAICEELGQMIGPRCVELLDDHVEAYGKAALVGTQGEVEHGSALIHNLKFGNVFRTAANGTELLPAAERIALPGDRVDIPLKHKVDARTRSHHQTVSFSVPGAPGAREILILCAATNSGRPLARLADFGHETT